MQDTQKLKQLIKDHSIVRAPGVYDGITARIVEQAGFPAVYMTGAGTSMSLGYPDYGLLTELSEENGFSEFFDATTVWV